MKFVKYVLIILIYLALFNITYNSYEGDEYQLTNTLFLSGLLLIIISIIVFFTRRRSGIMNRFSSTHFQAVQDTIVDSFERERHNENVSRAINNQKYSSKKPKYIFNPAFIALGIGFISIIMSFFF